MLPTTCISVYQAAVACQAAGKRLLTDSEWLAAAKGTPPTNESNLLIPADAEGNNTTVEVAAGKQTLNFKLTRRKEPPTE